MPKVIIADDEEFVRYFLEQIFSSINFNVVAEVDSGDLLIDSMRENNPDMLILDVNMPHVTGLEFLKEYAQEFPQTCIIILTGAVSAKINSELSNYGAQCIMRKDTPPGKMVSTIQETWEKFRKVTH
jgi:two-component system response regulator DegU